MELEQEASTAPPAAEEMVVEEPPVEVEPASEQPSEPPASSNASNASPSVASYASPAIAAPSSTSERVRLRDEINDCLKQIVLKNRIVPLRGYGSTGGRACVHLQQTYNVYCEMNPYTPPCLVCAPHATSDRGERGARGRAARCLSLPQARTPSPHKCPPYRSP